MTVVVRYSEEYPNLLVAVGDNFHDLGRILGISASAVSHAVHRNSELYRVVDLDEPDMWPADDGGLWYYDEHGRALILEA